MDAILLIRTSIITMIEKIKARIAELQKQQQQDQQQMQVLRQHLSNLEVNIIKRSGEIQGLQSLLEPEKPEVPVVPLPQK